MKFWKKIFLYSVVLFLVLLNCAGAILIENTFENNLQKEEKISMDKSTEIENILTLNIEYLKDAELSNEGNLTNWVKIMISDYAKNRNAGSFYLELFTNEDEVIVSDWSSEIELPRPELENVQKDQKVSYVREMNDQRYVFISSIVRLENTEFKLVVSKEIEMVYQQRVHDYESFLLVNLGISAILAFAMYVISRKLTRPIVALSEISKEIADGNYGRRIKEGGSFDEVGVLEKNFNKMVDVIENNIMELRYHNESKQRFIDSLNHEIKTPITSIIGYSELLLRSKLDEDMTRQALMYINSEARRLELLNSTLLKLTLVREEIMENEKVSLTSCVEEAVSSLRFIIEKRKVELKIRLEEISVWGNYSQMEVLLINLIDNAIKASKENSSILVTGSFLEKEKKYYLTIKDHGIGIAKEDLDKIVEPFYMVDKARTRKENGIGLGLAICNEICRSHKIMLSFASELGNGTEVTLKFGEESILSEKKKEEKNEKIF